MSGFREDAPDVRRHARAAEKTCESSRNSTPICSHERRRGRDRATRRAIIKAVCDEEREICGGSEESPTLQRFGGQLRREQEESIMQELKLDVEALELAPAAAPTAILYMQECQ